MKAGALRIWTPLAFSLVVSLGLTGDSRRGARLVSLDEFAKEAERAPSEPGNSFSLMAAELPLRAMLLQVRLAGEWNPWDVSQRKPDRMIRDPYAAYGAVAVDPNVRTSPGKTSEPKRLIGGLITKIEFQCGLYIN